VQRGEAAAESSEAAWPAGRRAVRACGRRGAAGLRLRTAVQGGAGAGRPPPVRRAPRPARLCPCVRDWCGGAGRGVARRPGAGPWCEAAAGGWELGGRVGGWG
jgi:hypothetical protein